MICPHCSFQNDHTKWFCTKCSLNMYEKGNGEVEDTHRRPMTAWEKMKLGFYRSEKKWIDNIKSRRFEKDRHGNKIIVSNSGEMPIPPKSIWAQPKGPS